MTPPTQPKGPAALPGSFEQAAAAAEECLRARGISLTLGGEPTYVPFDPAGDEWSVSALGPAKLGRALAFADAVLSGALPGGFRIITPGKLYPGEINPRWVVQILRPPGGRNPFPLADPADGHSKPRTPPAKLLRAVARALALPPGNVLEAADPTGAANPAAVLPLGHDGVRWNSELWSGFFPGGLELLAADGAVGLRLPLHKLPPGSLKSALTLEWSQERLRLFVPPLGATPFLALLRRLAALFKAEGIRHARLEGYTPPGLGEGWTRAGFAADPGVIEVNLPPCASWAEYQRWLLILHSAAEKAGLRSAKPQPDGSLGGTGGGNHILFGGPSLETNPFFTRPGWVASICRYFQRHPSLAYLFTGVFCGPASQAPRPDESGIPLEELELAYSTLERLPPGDHRALIADTLRNLHADASGSSHRCEISFDKFWCPSIPGGSAGLIEFRAIEAFPDPSWNAAVCALLVAIAARAAAKPFNAKLADWGFHLHDQYLLPSFIRQDLGAVLADLAAAGFRLGAGPWDTIWNWRFPILLKSPSGLAVRRAIEPWPLLSDIPNAGAVTSRFVDSSLARLEFTLPARLDGSCAVFVNGRPLAFPARLGRLRLAAVRFRATALYPSLHPAFPVQLPLRVDVALPEKGPGSPLRPRESWVLREPGGCFEPASPPQRLPRGAALAPLRPGLVTADLRF